MYFPIMAKKYRYYLYPQYPLYQWYFMDIFDHLLTPPPTKGQRFATFLPAIESFWWSHWSMKLNEPVINIHILTSFTQRRKRQRSPRV